jgi:acetyl-CoA carboxylase biotin carboxyl carrier protein
METAELYELIERLDKSGFARFRLREGEFEIEIERGGTAADLRPEHDAGLSGGAGVPGRPGAPEEGERDGREPDSPAGAEQSDGEGAAQQTETITSPIVGSFYRAPSPDAPPYAEPGAEMEKGQTLCIIEAMKVMNELEAEFPCRILRVLAENQQMVEYGTPLFEVERIE